MRLSKALGGFFLFFTADGKSAETLRGYRWILDRLTTFLDDKDVADVTLPDLQRFMLWLGTEYRPRQSEKISNATLLKGWVALRSFFGWAATEFNLPARPDKALKRPKATEPVIIPFTEDAVKALTSFEGRRQHL